jgi:hypothetical protein
MGSELFGTYFCQDGWVGQRKGIASGHLTDIDRSRSSLENPRRTETSDAVVRLTDGRPVDRN